MGTTCIWSYAGTHLEITSQGVWQPDGDKLQLEFAAAVRTLRGPPLGSPVPTGVSPGGSEAGGECEGRMCSLSLTESSASEYNCICI